MKFLCILSLMMIPTSYAAESQPAAGQGRLPRGPIQSAASPDPKDKNVEVKTVLPEGPVGKGKIPAKKGAAPQTSGTPPAKVSASQLVTETCNQYLSSPMHPRIWRDGAHIYFMGRSEKKIPKAGDHSADTFRYILYRVDSGRGSDGRYKVARDHIKKIFSFDGPLNVALVPHNSPPEGFTIVSFSGLMLGCPQGEGVGVTIPMPKAGYHTGKPMKSVPNGTYSIVESDKGRLIYEWDRHILKAIDPVSGQHRVLYNLPTNFSPLYWEGQRKLMYAWQTAPASSLSRMGSVASLKMGDLKLGRGERFAQHEGRFAILKSNAVENTIRMTMLNPWGTTGKSKVFALKLPQGVPVDEASILADFNRELALVYGGGPRSRELWNKLYVYDLAKRSSLSELSWNSSEVLDGAIIGNRGSSVVIFFEDRATGMATAVKLLDTVTGQWHVWSFAEATAGAL